jgi:hypothetical protein
MTVCLGDASGSIETAEDVCKISIEKFHSEIRGALRGVLFSEAFNEIEANKIKASNCSSKEFAVFKFRAIKTVEYAVENDCKMVMDYMSKEDNAKKLDWCKKNYSDELNLEKKLMGLGSDGVYQAIEKCVFLKNKETFDENKFKELLKKSNLPQASSFMELQSSDSETDDYDDDDQEISLEKPKQNLKKPQMEFSRNLKNFKKSNSEESQGENINLIEKSQILSNLGQNKLKKPIRKTPEASQNKEKSAIFRKIQMSKLQRRHTFQEANRENIDENFSIGKASMGKDNPDEFVSFLGYLRDASYKASKLIAKKEEQQLAKILREAPTEKKKGLKDSEE